MSKKPIAISKPAPEKEKEEAETDEFQAKDIETRMAGPAPQEAEEDETEYEYETTITDVILDGEGVEVDDPNEEGGKRYELKLPVGYKVNLTKKLARQYQDRGIGLKFLG